MARPGLLQHRKFRRLVRALDALAFGEIQVRGLGTSLALGSLELLWSTAYECGDEVLGTPEDVEHTAAWNGTPGVVFAALRDAGLPDQAGFIEEHPERPGVWRVHDLWDHAPDYVATRRANERERQLAKVCEHCGTEYHSKKKDSKFCSDRCRAAAWREGEKQSDANAQNASERTQTPTNASPAPAPAPAPAPVDQEACSELLFAASEPPAPAPPPSPVVALLPIVGQGPKEFPVTEAMVMEWRESYPGVDVRREVLRAVQWSRDNPAKRKTFRGARAFIGSWLARSQNQGGGGGPLAPAIGRGGALPVSTNFARDRHTGQVRTGTVNPKTGELYTPEEERAIEEDLARKEARRA